MQKTKLKSLLHYLLIVLLLSSCSQNKYELQLFGSAFELSKEFVSKEHDQSFLKLIHIEGLHVKQMHNLKNQEFNDMASFLLKRTRSNLKAGDVVTIYIFTQNPKGAMDKIQHEETHAFSLFSLDHGDLRHRYFEKSNNDGFKEVPSLTKTLKGGFSNDDIRMLHFAGIGKDGLPDNSTIYEFNKALEPKNVADDQAIDFQIRLALLSDDTRYWGAYTTGLYGEALQTALLAPNNPGGSSNFCGFVNPGPPMESGPTDPDTGCPQGSDPCYKDPVAGQKLYCTKKDGGSCFAAVATLLKDTQLYPDLKVDFRKIWKFQDEFLLNYDLGKDYMATSLIFSLFIQPDTESLKLAQVALPQLYDIIDLLMSDNRDLDDTIVITPEAYESIHSYINMGRTVKNNKFSSVLDRWERDLNAFKGLNKKDLIEQFKTYRTVAKL